MNAKRIAKQAFENGELGAEQKKLEEEWRVVNRGIILELGETDDKEWRAWKAHELAQERHPDLYVRLCEVDEEISRRVGIMTTMMAAGWAANYDREQALWSHLREGSS